MWKGIGGTSWGGARPGILFSQTARRKRTRSESCGHPLSNRPSRQGANHGASAASFLSITSSSRWLTSSTSSRVLTSIRSFSSTPLRTLEDEDTPTTDSVGSSFSSAPSSLPAGAHHQNWPRLQALRQRLQSESSSTGRPAAPLRPPRIVEEQKRAPPMRHPSVAMRLVNSTPSSSPSSPSLAKVAPPENNIKEITPSAGFNEGSVTTSWPSIRKIDWEALLRRLPPLPPSSADVLTDSFQRKHSYLRISLTERCNLRCTYCMPEEGVPLQPPLHLLQTPEILQLAHLFRQAGVTKFRLTGGEPTLRPDLIQVVQGLSALAPTSLGMTTNGITLARQLPDLMQAGLTSINLSLDTLQGDRFQALTRRPAGYLSKVMDSLDACIEARIPTKINCVVIRGVNDDEVADFCRLVAERTAGLGRHSSQGETDSCSSLLQMRFIEYMPFTGNGWNWDRCVPYRELVDRVAQQGISLHPLPPHDPHDTTKWYTMELLSAPGHSMSPPQVGFITSMSEHFCASCNRLRLTADGQLKVCLFDDLVESSGAGSGMHWSLRDALRSGLTTEQMQRLVHAALGQKKASLGGHASPQDVEAASHANRPMTLIGG